MAPYPIKHGARAICNASQSSDWPTSRMNLLYAVHAVDFEDSSFVSDNNQQRRRKGLRTKRFGKAFYVFLG